MARAIIGIGSNQGDRLENLLSAIERCGLFSRVLRVSRFRETEPSGDVDQPRFLNGVIEVETQLLPRDLLSALLGVEADLGRLRTRKWGPRTLDLDILAYEDCVLDEDGLVLPHPRIPERKFVLEPLSEIRPDWAHPLSGLTAAEMLRGLEGPGQLSLTNER